MKEGELTVTMRRHTILGAVAILVIALLAWSWIDAGREPVRDIIQPVPVPELPK
ncbi:hypothetical protein NSU_3962 [Novosphingobium pentaromativorans US6-1]|uniref:Uncharacterized protein n=1 Tax=Novosphingobium pentaromativorans US6-1 TaxID=1088721 RepID=G6EHZ1_9SPHN|nr:hypothetical protein NSU_3962 [Novosphingobium pentaromativorans US6-1]